jgi:hypothetical protein
VRIVFDTKVIVAGLLAEGLCREVIETHVPEHTPIQSQTFWNELVDTLRDKFQLSLDDLPVLHCIADMPRGASPNPWTHESAATQTMTGYWRRHCPGRLKSSSPVTTTCSRSEHFGASLSSARGASLSRCSGRMSEAEPRRRRVPLLD